MVLKEARRLWDLGWGVHWLRPRSKAPVKKGWTTGPRDSWEQVLKDYRPDYGLGVRMGEASALPGGGFLANIDVDIKSAEPRHRTEALEALELLYPGLLEVAPIVQTSYGLRLFIRTAKPLESGKLHFADGRKAKSAEDCIVYMPTSEISKEQRKAAREGKITESQLNEGYRIRPAWELEFMSAGRQVVLPPSVHSETGQPYSWQRPLAKGSLPLVTAKTAEVSEGRQAQDSTPRAVKGIAEKFRPVKVDIEFSVLPDTIVRMIVAGDGADDRSAAIFTVAKAMKKAKFSDNEILSVLTDTDYHLGETGYHHRKTKNRAKAAEWVAEHTLRKAALAVSPQHAFREAAEPPEQHASAEEAAAAADELTATPWVLRLERYKGKGGEEGAPKPTLENTVLVLENAIGRELFKFNEFRSRDVYGVDAPWVKGKVGKQVSDKDPAHIMLWIGRKYRFEPSKATVWDAITCIADQNTFHPVRDELEALESWDGTPRLDTFLVRCFGAKILKVRADVSTTAYREYLAQVFRKWVVASVWRTYEPGTKMDWLPIFEGKQGIGKSKIGPLLFGKKYFRDNLPPLEKDADAAVALEGFRCVEMAELVALGRAEARTAKAFFVREVDSVRRAYGRQFDELPRQCVFFGTTNEENYLKDPTGDRRYMPVEVGELDEASLVAERDQLWAEALFIYQNGLEAHLYLEGAARDVALALQKDKLVADESQVMADELRVWVAREMEKAGGRFDFRQFKLTKLFAATGPLGRWPSRAGNLQYAARALKELGAKKKKIHGAAWWEMTPEALEKAAKLVDGEPQSGDDADLGF